MIRKVATVLASLFALNAYADSENPYVGLYKSRLEITRTVVQRNVAVEEFKSNTYERMHQLYAQNAASREEFEQAFADFQVAKWTRKDSEIRVTEAESLLQIAQIRIAAGQDMPICGLDTTN